LQEAVVEPATHEEVGVAYQAVMVAEDLQDLQDQVQLELLTPEAVEEEMIMDIIQLQLQTVVQA
jgi:hypothetical protein